MIKHPKVFEEYDAFNNTSEWYDRYFIHVKWFGENSVEKWPNSYIVQFKDGKFTKVTVRDFGSFKVMNEHNCYILEWLKDKHCYKVVWCTNINT